MTDNPRPPLIDRAAAIALIGVGVLAYYSNRGHTALAVMTGLGVLGCAAGIVVGCLLAAGAL